MGWQRSNRQGRPQTPAASACCRKPPPGCRSGGDHSQPQQCSLPREFAGVFLHPGLSAGALLKISDRGLAYSIGRASRELLYIPIDPVRIHRAKAWIDMFGYRLFKGLGSVLVLASTQWLPASLGAASLSWITVTICLAWLAVIAALRGEYCLRVCGLPGCGRRVPA